MYISQVTGFNTSYKYANTKLQKKLTVNNRNIDNRDNTNFRGNYYSKFAEVMTMDVKNYHDVYCSVKKLLKYLKETPNVKYSRVLSEFTDDRDSHMMGGQEMLKALSAGELDGRRLIIAKDSCDNILARVSSTGDMLELREASIMRRPRTMILEYHKGKPVFTLKHGSEDSNVNDLEETFEFYDCNQSKNMVLKSYKKRVHGDACATEYYNIDGTRSKKFITFLEKIRPFKN